MEIKRDLINTAVVNRHLQGDKRIGETSASALPQVPGARERRRRRDRRQRQLAFKGPDRRKNADRRTRRPDLPDDQRGHFVDAKV